jgi:hypothetical protein
MQSEENQNAQRRTCVRTIALGGGALGALDIR